MMAIPIVIGTFGTVIKGQVQGQEDLEIRGWIETNETTTLLRSARIQRRIQDSYRYSDSSEKPSANAGVKNSQMSKIIDLLKNNNIDILKEKQIICVHIIIVFT